MVVDSEMGMPLNLNHFEGVWEGNEEGQSEVLSPLIELIRLSFEPRTGS